jgi:hypothetical protein
MNDETERIHSILTRFDFESIRRTRESFKCTLLGQARVLLNEVAAARPPCVRQRNGFLAKHDEEGTLSLEFILTPKVESRRV